MFPQLCRDWHRTGDSGSVGAAFPLAGEGEVRCLMGTLHNITRYRRGNMCRCGVVMYTPAQGDLNTGGMFTRLSCIT